MSVNKVILLGNLGDDVKMHYFEGGGCIGKFTVATSSSYNNKNTGEKVTETEWHNIVVRNKTAEVIEKYFKKGDEIYLEGRKKTDKWEDNDGNTRYTVNIELREFSFTRGSNNQQQQAATTDAPSQPKQEEQDLPF